MRESIDLNYYAKSNWRRPQIYKPKLQTMTSFKLRPCFLSGGLKKIDGTEYFAIVFILLNLEAWNLVGVNKIENK